MKRLFIDIETYSDVDIAKAGLYRYAQSPAFEVLLLAYSPDGGPVRVVDLAGGEKLPPELTEALRDPETEKHAFNAAFEWTCLSRWLRLADPKGWLLQWRCTMLHSLYCGYPASLDAAGAALGLDRDQRKLAAGRALVRYFCAPCKPTKKNGGRTRNKAYHDPDKWALFREYNARDVEAEMEIEHRLRRFPVPDEVQRQWVTDQIINSRGVAVDTALVAGAEILDTQARNGALREAAALTGLANPNSRAQLIEWLTKETGSAPEDLKKSTVAAMLNSGLPEGAARRVLELRQELGKTSVKKYTAIETAVCEDGRVRGLLQFYGANRTGRWAGRIVQPQNLPRTHIDDGLLPLARELVKARRAAPLRWIFGSVPDTLSQLARTALTASEGRVLIDADFSAIEARVVAWLAGEEWVLEVFRTHGRIYEATAAQLYGVPVEQIKKGSELRQRGKAATLALGYAGGASALITAGGLPADTPVEELLDLRDRWRQANPHTCRLWQLVDNAARAAAERGQRTELMNGRLVFARETDPENGPDFMTVLLPGGRKLYYAEPHMGLNRFGQPAACYMGRNQQTGRWAQVETFGGKLVENITQAVARDILAEAVTRLEAAGYEVVFHVHDEVIIDARPEQRLADVIDIMRQPPAWAPDLPLNADGWVNQFYKKE